MKFHVLTLFPEMVEFGLNQSIIKRAKDRELIDLNVVNIRDYAFNKHKQVDDYPYGGGAGMLMQAEPIVLAYEDILRKRQERHGDVLPSITENEPAEVEIREADLDQDKFIFDIDLPIFDTDLPIVLYMSPQGEVFTQELAKELAREKELVFLCGHYEGVDERALEMIGARSISIGDYVLTGGELPAMVMIDAISRMVGGVLTNEESADFESFEDNLLEYPQYTRPQEFRGMEVPKIMLSGHHKNIERWRRKESIRRTVLRRPDLLLKANLSKSDLKLLDEVNKELERGEQ